jgi:hypothetical protein
MTYVRTVSRSGPEIPFQLTSVDETPAPDGCDGVWQRYVITQGANTIVGVRCGLHDEVTVQLTDVVERLNMRFTKAVPTPKGARGRPAKSARPTPQPDESVKTPAE